MAVCCYGHSCAGWASGKTKLLQVEVNAVRFVSSEHARVYGLMVQSVYSLGE